MSFTTLYGLFALVSIALFNSLLLLARYVRQTRSAPIDEDFEKIILEKAELKALADQEHSEVTGLTERVQKLEEDIKKMEESLNQKTQELENLKRAPAPAAQAG